MTHPDINTVPLPDYTADVVKGEPALRAALAARGNPLRYFRHPFLHAGPTPDLKAGLQKFLDDVSWIHRRSKTKGMPGKGEPDPPAWVTTAFDAR